MSEALFVGRERETDLYKQFLAKKTPWMLIITGLGGIGKSTLLHRLAEYTLKEPTLSETGVVTFDFADEELRNDPLKLLDKLTKDTAAYCDVLQIDVELKNELQQNYDQLAQLSKERIQTGVSEAEDPALREMRHQMRQLATEAFYTQIKTFTLDRLVIMLDTCEWLNEPEGVEVGQWVQNELIPGIHTRIRQKGRQCSVVMASRLQPRLDVINGQDQRRLTLPMLGKAEVDRYLEQMGMQDSDLRQRVYEVTHGHALCISIIGDYWQNRAEQSHPFTIADLPELELQEISEIALIRFTNERVLRHLKTPFKELTRYGVLLRSFDLPLLKKVFPELLPESAALERFNQLIRHPYIESRGNYRYAFHELVHEALTEETQKEEPKEWKCYHKRALDYFTTVSPHSPDWYYHLLAYDEKQGLMEWQQAVQEARESGKREFIGALLQATLDKALKLSPAARAEIVYEQGRFNYYGVQWEEALKSYKEALTSFQEVGDHSGQAKVLQAMGDVQRVLARQDDALVSYENALASFQQTGDLFGEAKCYQAMGDVCRLRNDLEVALQCYQQAFDLFRRVGNRPEEAKVLEALGDVQYLRNQPDAALRSYEQALTLYPEEKDRLKRAKVLNAKGDVQSLLQNKNAALESYGQALALFGELKEPTEEANVRRSIAEFTYASLPSDEHRMLARALFLRLIDPGFTEQDTTSRRAALTELSLPNPQQTTIIRETADAFIAARLLITNEAAGITTIEMSHETFIREWARLTEWLREARGDLHLLKVIREDAAEWRRSGRSLDRLYRDTQLAEAIDWRDRFPLGLDEEVFLEASAREQVLQEVFRAENLQKEEEKALQLKPYPRRTIILGLGLAGLAVAGGGLAWLIISSQKQHPPAPSPSPTPIPLGRVLYTYRGHSALVNAVVWSPDGRRIASGSYDHTVQVWDAADGSHAFTYQGHSSPVNAAAWSPDSRRIASGSNDKTVQVWDAADGSHAFTYQGHPDVVLAVAWSPDGKRIASGGVDKTVQVWDAADGSHAFTYKGHSNVVDTVAWSPDGKRIVSGSYDNTVQVWDAADGGHAFTYQGHSGLVHVVAWSPDGTRIASGSDDKTVQVWDAANGGHAFTYLGHSDIVLAVAWSPDGKRIASGGVDKTVQVWDAANGSHAFTYRGHSAVVDTVAWSSDGKRIASGSYDQTVQVWEAG